VVETVVFGLSLSAALFATEPTPHGRGAAVYAARATYYQSGFNNVIEPIAKDLDRRYIPQELRNLGVGASFVYRLIKDNRVEYGWSF